MFYFDVTNNNATFPLLNIELPNTFLKIFIERLCLWGVSVLYTIRL